jgi:hypothetical protein
MDSVSNQSWFLRKHQDGTVFGPFSFDQLSCWASTARIAPRDELSADQQTWLKHRCYRNWKWIGWLK